MKREAIALFTLFVLDANAKKWKMMAMGKLFVLQANAKSRKQKLQSVMR